MNVEHNTGEYQYAGELRYRLSPHQLRWLRAFKFYSQEKAIYKRAYDKYIAIGGNESRESFSRFFSGVKSSRGTVASLPVVEAEKAFKSIDMSREQMELIGDVTNGSDESIEDKFLESCAEILWNGFDNQAMVSGVDIPEIFLGIIDNVICRKTSFSGRQRSLIFADLIDYLLEDRQYERWERWVWFLARDYRQYFNFHKHQGYSDWFPGCYNLTGNNVTIREDYLEDLSENEFADMAYLVFCKNLNANAARHVIFKHTVAIERLTSKLALLRSRGSKHSSEIKNTEFELEKHLREKSARKRWLRAVFAEMITLVEPVWKAVGRAHNPRKWNFMLSCARMFYDYAKYHFYSSWPIDRQRAIELFEDIIKFANECPRDKPEDRLCYETKGEIKLRFNYLAAMAHRYIAEDAETPSERLDMDAQSAAIENVRESLRLARDAFDGIADLEFRVSSGHRKALQYRMKRHLARTITFAVRWALKRRLLETVFDKDTYPIGEATEDYHSAFCELSRNRSSRQKLVLKGKRKLEWEFHLRVVVESLIYDFEQIARKAQYGEQARLMAEARTTICLIALIYCYLFSAREEEYEEHRPFTHISRELESRVRDYLMAVNNESSSFLFDYSFLKNIKQEEPPSLTSQLETLCAIFYRFGSVGCEASKLYEILNIKMAGGKASDLCFYRKIWTQLRDAFNEDKKFVLKVYADECKEFLRKHGAVSRNNFKTFPLYRHRFEMIYGPGSNSRDVDFIFSACNLDWNPSKQEILV